MRRDCPRVREQGHATAIRAHSRSGLHRSQKEVRTPRFQPGDYVKAEFKDGVPGEGEWVWVGVDSCDDGAGVPFGRLDNEPLLSTVLHVGNELAASYEKIVKHRKAPDFEKQ